MNRKIVVFLLVAFLAACVTINIYFPAAAAQEVADQIIDDVWQLKKDEKTKNDEAGKTKSQEAESKDTSEAATN